MVGVHVRRTDNSISIKHSPLSGFIKYMNNEIHKNNKTTFFLATDSQEVEENLKAIFPGRIHLYPKRSFDRNSPEAIKDALVDLICLSSTHKIIGSYWSSFSSAAASLGDIPITVVNEH